MCGAEQDQGLSLQPCWVCRGLGWAQMGWLWDSDYPHPLLGVLPSSGTSQSGVKPKAGQL